MTLLSAESGATLKGISQIPGRMLATVTGGVRALRDKYIPVLGNPGKLNADGTSSASIPPPPDISNIRDTLVDEALRLRIEVMWEASLNDPEADFPPITGSVLVDPNNNRSYLIGDL